MGFLQCDKQTLITILESLAQQANLPALNTEIMLMRLELIAHHPKPTQSLQEALQS